MPGPLPDPLLLVLLGGAAGAWVSGRWHRRAASGRELALELERVLAVAATLHRLEAEIDWLLHADRRLPGRHHRLVAASRAYDDTLLAGCRLLGLSPPVERAPIPAVERLTVEAELARAGVRW